jgi:hypothetical protein
VELVAQSGKKEGLTMGARISMSIMMMMITTTTMTIMTVMMKILRNY